MARTLTPDRGRLVIALVAAALALTIPSGLGQALVVVLGGVVGAVFLRTAPAPPADEQPIRIPWGRRAGAAVLAVFAILLIALPIARQLFPDRHLAVFESFFVAASFVFGGGHVVLPLLQAQVVSPGWVTNGQFLAGYGAAQAVPGPLFTFSAYLGAIMSGPSSSVSGAALALVAMFAPSFFLVIGTLPFWDSLRGRPAFQAVLRGVNAAVVGLLLAALYNPVWVSTVHNNQDFLLVLLGFGLLFVMRAPPWVVVTVTGTLGAVLHALAR
jgi:chromate transporter